MLKIKSIGSEFKKALDEKAVGKVLLISRRALLINLNNMIFEILSSNMPRSTISAIVSKKKLINLPLTVGDPVECRKKILLKGVDLEVNFAEVWAWDLKKEDFSLHKNTISRSSYWIENILKSHISHLINGAQDPLLQTTLDKITVAFNFSKEKLESDHNNRIHDLLNLIGLGPGLTPAGDDVLAGFLTGAYYFVPQDSLFLSFVTTLRSEIDRKITTTYSKRLLNLAASGISNEYTRGLILGIVDQNYAIVTHNAKKILRLGSTSGFFYLLGFLRALELAMF